MRKLQIPQYGLGAPLLLASMLATPQVDFHKNIPVMTNTPYPHHVFTEDLFFPNSPDHHMAPPPKFIKGHKSSNRRGPSSVVRQTRKHRTADGRVFIEVDYPELDMKPAETKIYTLDEHKRVIELNNPNQILNEALRRRLQDTLESFITVSRMQPFKSPSGDRFIRLFFADDTQADINPEELQQITHPASVKIREEGLQFFGQWDIWDTRNKIKQLLFIDNDAELNEVLGDFLYGIKPNFRKIELPSIFSRFDFSARIKSLFSW